MNVYGTSGYLNRCAASNNNNFLKHLREFTLVLAGSGSSLYLLCGGKAPDSQFPDGYVTYLPTGNRSDRQLLQKMQQLGWGENLMSQHEW